MSDVSVAVAEPSWRNGRKQSSSISQLEENKYKTKTKQVVDFVFCHYFNLNLKKNMDQEEGRKP